MLVRDNRLAPNCLEASAAPERLRWPHALWRDAEVADSHGWQERGLLQWSNSPETESNRKDQSWESHQMQADFMEAHRTVKGKEMPGLQEILGNIIEPEQIDLNLT